MSNVIIASTTPGDKDPLLLAEYKTKQGGRIMSNLAMSIFNPLTGENLVPVSDRAVTASLDKVEKELVHVTSCATCDSHIHMDGNTARGITASLLKDGSDPVTFFCPTCGTGNKVTAADLQDENEQEERPDPGMNEEERPQDNDERGEDHELPRALRDNNHNDDPRAEGSSDNEDIDPEHQGNGNEPDDDEINSEDEGQEPDFDPDEYSEGEEGDANENGDDAQGGGGNDEQTDSGADVQARVEASVNMPASDIEVSTFEAVASDLANRDLSFVVIDPNQAMVLSSTPSGSKLPIMTLERRFATKENKDLFDSPDRLTQTFASVVASPNFDFTVENCAPFGARDISFRVPVQEAIKSRIEAGITAVTASAADDKANLINDARQCMSIASTEVVKNLRSDRPNLIRSSIVARLERLGITEASDIVDRAFEESGERVFASIIDRSVELMRKPVEVRNEISEQVTASNFVAAPASAPAKVSAALERGNMPFTNPVTASTPTEHTPSSGKVDWNSLFAARPTR